MQGSRAQSLGGSGIYIRGSLPWVAIGIFDFSRRE